MGYTNETIHYGIPKPLGTDLTVPQDYNDAADRIDQDLFDASTNATEAVTAAANAVEAAAGAVEEVASIGTEVNNLKGRTSALETSDVIQNNKIDALENQGVTKFDSAGIADPYVNGLTYSVGDVVTYNGQRYKCITAVVAAEPFDADKWSAEDVETVLDELKSDLADIEDVVPDFVVDTSTTGIRVTKYGKIVTIEINGTFSENVDLKILPSEIRPTVNERLLVANASDNKVAYISVASATGVIRVLNLDVTTLSNRLIVGSGSYTID